ncbi:MAG: Kae1-associated serine/threonine protein kinase [Euryarchaeota archaeon]|nr:Kae1-associated serine/threonine protein kinase [Euryarchaeota archaeon]MDE1835872.1 Kae1-associated serine/threonine protein kinase [Euryarchaeota archaeon]MDE1881379.1 Kae1-associated serine/threonine protein kinase [Euryarchaeota archaeon]MDE2044450.1 Kae1-associated serine/threonine protein kinase [Thermoplasmata archaeon]
MSRLAEGAEAVVTAEDILGVRAVRKHRFVKGYRDPALDQRLRGERLRTEVRLLREARRAGIRTPIVLDVELEGSSLLLEWLDGPTLSEVLTSSAPRDATRARCVERWGQALGKLHAAGVAHGDLTASNVLWCDGDVAFLDLSLGSRSPGIEELGIDLHLVREDLNTLCPDREELYERFLTGYRSAFPTGCAAVEARAKEIQGRVRYS